MSDQPPQQPSDTPPPKVTNSAIIQEALAKQAAQRGPKAPPKYVSAPPTLPKVRKHRRRRRTV
jgi:hypothetical protein